MARLVLGREVGERVRVKVNGVKFYVSPSYVRGRRVGLLFEAPPEVQLEREELPERDAA